MKKYQLAWVGIPGASDVRLGSTDPDLVSWFLDNLKTIAPKWEYRRDRISGARDLDGNKTYCCVHKLDSKDTEINFWLIQELLKAGWEPFSITVAGQHASADLIFLRREVIENS
jgi:hypothetical protein